ncbi:InlB B-repeat-containing protein [Tenacibaculum finnmarkense]|nr:InlB B-repeat-containing protein [Tenacibaculum finnmarkense]
MSGSEKVHYELYNNEYTKTASDHLPVSVRLKFIGNYTVKYTAGNNGTITGDLSQNIEEGKATSQVKAIADAGYEFVKWSDGNTSETRTDIADTDKEFTAEFVKVIEKFTVKYTAGNNGTITGDLAQTIEEGNSTSQVKAIADARI